MPGYDVALTTTPAHKPAQTGAAPTHQDAKDFSSMFAKADTNKDGAINQTEFDQFLKEYCPPQAGKTEPKPEPKPEPAQIKPEPKPEPKPETKPGYKPEDCPPDKAQPADPARTREPHGERPADPARTREPRGERPADPARTRDLPAMLC